MIKKVKLWIIIKHGVENSSSMDFFFLGALIFKFLFVFSFLVAMGDISLRKTSVEEKRAKVQKDSRVLLDYTRKAIARLTYLKR